jgi:hypothetical protein
MAIEHRDAAGAPRDVAEARVRPRHDGFTREKRERFLAEVERSGCIKDGCRAAGISKTTVERWRDKDAEFAAALGLKLDLAAVSLERLAFDRALRGGEEVVIRKGKIAMIRRKPSDAMLRMLLQGANPAKYGRTGGERQASEAARRRMKDELRPELFKEFMGGRTHEELVDEGLKKMDRVFESQRNAQRAQGYREAPEDYPDGGGRLLIAPGWVLTRESEGG